MDNFISLDGYGSKIRKVRRYRPTVSNGTILATKQEFFFTKGFITNTASLYFIQHYHLFFRKEFFFWMYTLFECSYLIFRWEIGHPLIMYATGGREGGRPKCVQVRTGGEGYHASCVCMHLRARNLFTVLWSLDACTVLWCLVLFVEI